MGRRPCCEKVGLRKGRWTEEEDARLKTYILANGEGSWRSLPKNAGLLRCGKSCRLRWINYLRSDLKRGNITTEEEDTIIKLHSSIGNRWSLIASHLPGRTDNEIKNYWNSHLSRQIHTFRRQNSADTGRIIIDVARLNLPPRRKGGRSRRSNRPAEEIRAPPGVERETTCVAVEGAAEERESVDDSNKLWQELEGRHDADAEAVGSFNNDVTDDMSFDLDGLLTYVEWDDETKSQETDMCESKNAVAAAEVEIGGDLFADCNSTTSSFRLDSPWDWESLAGGHRIWEWDAADPDAGEAEAGAAESDAVISWLLSES